MYMIYNLLYILFCIICIEASTELLSKSEIFKFVREFLFNRRKCKLFAFIHEMVDCSYCLSVWLSALYVCFFYLVIIDLIPFGFIFIPIVVVFHRLSNILHFLIDRVNGNSNLNLEQDKDL